MDAEKPEALNTPWIGRRISNKLGYWWRSTGQAENSNRIVAFATAFIALATFVSTYEIVTGSNDTKRIVTAAENIKAALNTANSQNQMAFQQTLAQSQTALQQTLGQSQVAMEASNKQSKTALDATIAQSRLDQRAFVSLGKNLQENAVMTSDNSDVQGWEFRPYMENSGDTPTRNAQVHANFLWLPMPLPTNFPFHDIDQPTIPNTRFMLGPKETATGPLLSIPIAVLQAVKDKTTHLYFYGWLTYQDVFPKTPQYITMFCEEITDVRGQLKPGSGIAMAWALCPRHNCADDECRGESYGNPARVWKSQ